MSTKAPALMLAMTASLLGVASVAAVAQLDDIIRIPPLRSPPPPEPCLELEFRIDPGFPTDPDSEGEVTFGCEQPGPPL